MAKSKKSKKLKHPSLMETAHDIAKGLYQIGVMDAQTMRKFDLMCLPEVKELSSSQIKKLRLREKVSQPIFASCLNISAATVKKWEQGEKRPSGTAMKLLNLVAERGLDFLKSNEPIAA